MNKNKDTNKDNNKSTTTAATTNAPTTQPTIKLGVFEEDDYFEEFDDEEWVGNQADDIDFKRWQEDWEDEDINDQFDKVLRREMEAFKNKSVSK